MFDLRRGLVTAALAATFAASPAPAQDAAPNTSPELRNFSLSPNLPTIREREPLIEPVRPQQQPPRPQQPATAPPVVVAPPPPAAQTPRPRPAPREAAPVQRRVAPPVQQAPVEQAPVEQAPATTVPSGPQPAPDIPLAIDQSQVGPIEMPSTDEAAPVATSTPEEGGWMVWGGVAAALFAALALAYALRQHRSAAAARAEADALTAAHEQEARAARAEAERARAAALVAAREREEAEAQMRPWVEIEFHPASASATGERAHVEFELVVRNRGRSEARNVRISGKMLNAGSNQNAELAAFFGETLDGGDGPTHSIAPGQELRFDNAFAFAKEDMRPILVKERSLLIPLVAFNVRYEWGVGRAGQTATSYIVGRESNPPTEKMAPFRLDLGPRVYRQVGVRENELKLVA